MSTAQPARHEVVVEVYDNIAIGMRCCTCHERIPVRPEGAAITVAEAIRLVTEHQSAVAAIDAPISPQSVCSQGPVCRYPKCRCDPGWPGGGDLGAPS